MEDSLAGFAGPSCAIESMLKALNMVATYTDNSDLKLANTISGVANDKALQPGMAYAAGVSSFPTKDLVHQVDVLGEDVQSINEGYWVGKGMVTETDPNAYKLLAAQADFDKILQPFLGIASAKAAVDAINLYVTLVQKRNADIMKYNGYVAQIASVQSQIDQNTAQFNGFANQQELTSNPSLAPVAAFMARLYHDARARVIYAIYMASRSCAFWSLDPGYNVFASFVGLNDPTGINAATLGNARDSILSKLDQAIENFGSGPQNFPLTDGNSQSASSSQTNSTTVDSPPEFSLILTAADHPGMFETFKTKSARGLYQLSFSMPAPLQGVPTDSPFAGFYNVRLSRVRPWIHGVTKNDPNNPGNHVLHVGITHSGVETIVDPNSKPHGFTHEPIAKAFLFDYTLSYYTSAAISMDGGGFDPKGEDANYAQPGPFTVWTITLDPLLNIGLDMTNVNKIVVEFWGNAYAFNPS
jgi:hypothetical protein